MARSTLYHLIDQKLITPSMYKDAPDIDTAFSGSWHNAFVGALSNLGVSLVEREVSKSEEVSFLEGKDKVRDIPVLFPLGTFGYGYKGDVPPVASMATVAGEYSKTTKLFMYHFAYNGREYTAQLLVTANGSVNLTLWDKSSDKLLNFNISSDGNNKDTKLIEDLMKVVLSLVEAGYVGELSDKSYSYNATMELLKKSGIESSRRPFIPVSAPALTQHDVETLLSSSSPTYVWWSPSLCQAVVRDRKGWCVASFRYLSSGWTLDWFTLSASLVKSKGKHLVSRKASFYEDSLSALVSCKSAVMYSKGGVSHYLPFE